MAVYLVWRYIWYHGVSGIACRVNLLGPEHNREDEVQQYMLPEIRYSGVPGIVVYQVWRYIVTIVVYQVWQYIIYGGVGL